MWQRPEPRARIRKLAGALRRTRSSSTAWRSRKPDEVEGRRRYAVSTADHPWGRIDADGTVYVRTADGERVIGSWQAGRPEEALGVFRRKVEAVEAEGALIEQRINATDVSPAQAQATVRRLLASVSDANALGDLEGLKVRLEALTS